MDAQEPPAIVYHDAGYTMCSNCVIYGDPNIDTCIGCLVNRYVSGIQEKLENRYEAVDLDYPDLKSLYRDIQCQTNLCREWMQSP